jgi:hypothetical protein
VNGVVVDVFNPYTMQWNLTLEQEYAGVGFRASYIGTRSVDLLYRSNLNQPPASRVPFANSRRPYPQYLNVTMVSNGAIASYHALLLQAEKRMSRGLLLQAGWTWAKELDEANATATGESGDLIEDAYNRAPERGNHFYLPRQRFVSSYIWDLPVGPGQKLLGNLRGFAGHLAGGWEFAGSITLRTGQFFTPSFSGSDPSNTNTLSGRPDRIANGNLPAGKRVVNHWFDATAFVVPPANAGRFGNAGVGILEGPGTQAFNLGLYKNFKLREGARLQFNLSALNAFNHPNFRNPAANISSPTSVGIVSATQTVDGAGPRTVIIGAKVNF